MILFFAKHPTAANLLMFFLIVMGFRALPRLERETFPDFIDPEVVIRVSYPGATAAEIEDAVCRRIEDAVEGVTHVDEIIAEARENLALVTVSMKEGAHFQKFMNDIKTEVEGINDFPDPVETPIIRSLGEKQPVVSIAVSGNMSVLDLKTYSEDLKNRLMRLDAVSLVTLKGFSDRQIRIEVPSERLLQLGLNPTALANIISRQSLDLPVGALETQAGTVLVRLAEERRSPKEFANLVIAGSPSGAEVLLGDIAQIKDVFDLEEEKIIFNGRRAALLEVQKTTQEDALRVLDAVRGFVEQEGRRVPGISLTLTRDLTSITRDRLKLLGKNAWQGLVLVFFTLWLFFNIRLSFWVTMGLPVSFLGAFFLLPMTGMSINMITMVGLLLALGLMMDDAIVIGENVASHLQRGENTLRAVVAGVNEVKWGVISSFLTTVAVFGPLTLLSGNIGKILRVMPVVLILVLAVSLVEAFFILPNHLVHSLRKTRGRKESRFRVWFDGHLDYFRENVLGKTVDWAVRHRFLTVGLTAALFLLSLAMIAGGNLKFQAFPSLDGDVVEARLMMPQGTPLARTEALIGQLEEALDQVAAELQPLQPAGLNMIRNTNIQFNQNSSAGVSGTHVATFSVDLLSAELRQGSTDQILDRWREQVGMPTDVVSLVFSEPSLAPTGYPLEIRLYGQDLHRLKEASLELQSWFGSFEGVRDLQDDLQTSKPELQIHMKQGALALGLTAADLANQLRGAFLGITARQIQVGDAAYDIEVRLPESDRNALPDLEYFHVILPNGSQAPLETVARLEVAERGFGKLVRINGNRTATVRGDVATKTANVKELMAAFRAEFVPILNAKFPDLDFSIEGETAETDKTSASLKSLFQIGVLGIFLMLSFQFRSYKEPLIVMAAIPLSLIGVIWGHLLLGYPLTMPSMMGFVSLMGVVVNDSILLVIFIKKRIGEGCPAIEAVCGASRDRFRAVLLTSLTTAAGLLPLLAEQSMQAQILIPLAISLIFGLMASTILVLIVIPSLYAMTGIAHALEKNSDQAHARNGPGNEIATDLGPSRGFTE